MSQKMAGANPLVPGSPDIDVKTSMTITEDKKNGTLRVVAVMSGDRFPAAEAFIGDAKGQQVFIGTAGYEGNPYTSLPGEGNKEMMVADITIKIDEHANFLGVESGGKTYSIQDWNKKEEKSPYIFIHPPGFDSYAGGRSGGAGASGNW